MSTSDRARYFVSDKNIYDALNLNRVDRKTIQKLFRKSCFSNFSSSMTMTSTIMDIVQVQFLALALVFCGAYALPNLPIPLHLREEELESLKPGLNQS